MIAIIIPSYSLINPCILSLNNISPRMGNHCYLKTVNVKEDSTALLIDYVMKWYYYSNLSIDDLLNLIKIDLKYLLCYHLKYKKDVIAKGITWTVKLRKQYFFFTLKQHLKRN